MTRPTTDAMLDLADAVARDGVAAHRRDVDALAGWARARGLRPVLLEVLDDPDVPDAVHQRALGRLIVAVCRWVGGGDGRPGDPSAHTLAA